MKSKSLEEAKEDAIYWWDDEIPTSTENEVLMKKYNISEDTHWNCLSDEVTLKIYLGEHPDIVISEEPTPIHLITDK